MDELEVNVTVNGKALKRRVEPRLLLSDFIRHGIGLTGIDAGHDEDPRAGQDGAQADCFLYAGDTKPLRAGGGQSKSTALESMAVRIGLDNGEQVRIRSGQPLEKPVIVKQPAARNFSPDGAGMRSRGVDRGLGAGRGQRAT